MSKPLGENVILAWVPLFFALAILLRRRSA